MKNFAKLFFCSAVALILCSCASDQYYQNRAAEEARKYLLERTPELTAEQVEFVRYNDPVLLIGDVLGKHSVGGIEKTSSIQRQICITWRIPGKDELYMVMGVSADDMIYWEPQRLIRKKFIKTGTGQESALSAARAYIPLNLYTEITAAELNQTLYQFPFIVETNFELNFNSYGNLSEQELENIHKQNLSKKQFSLLWKSPDRNVVISGYAMPDMGGWQLVFAGVLTDQDVQEHLVQELNDPENFYRPIDLSEKEPEVTPEASTETSTDATKNVDSEPEKETEKEPVEAKVDTAKEVDQDVSAKKAENTSAPETAQEAVQEVKSDAVNATEPVAAEAKEASTEKPVAKEE